MSVVEAKTMSVRLQPSASAALAELARRAAGGSLNQALNLAVEAVARPCEPWAQHVLCLTAPQRAEVALEAWARMVAVATADNERTFNPLEWEYLRQALAGVLWSGQEVDPGARIAERVRQVEHERALAPIIWDGATTKGGSGRALGAFVRKLDCLPVSRAWAVIYSVAHALDNRRVHGEPLQAEWWTLAARTSRASGKNDTGI